VLLSVDSLETLEAELAAGRLRCPSCGRPLAPWGHARERDVRTLQGVRSLRPRRALCKPCQTTRVLLPAWSVPRRRDGTEVILSALVDAARGAGHRTIARRLGRPPGTVRGWLRRARRGAGQLKHWATVSLYRFEPPDRGLDPRVPCTDAPLADAVQTLGQAIGAAVRRHGPHGDPLKWAVVLTGGLIAGRPRDPPPVY
jgi:transposase-like protein